MFSSIWKKHLHGWGVKSHIATQNFDKTPKIHFSVFTTLRTFNLLHFQHSAFWTLCIFNTPYFHHSAFSTLRDSVLRDSAYSCKPLPTAILARQLVVKKYMFTSNIEGQFKFRFMLYVPLGLFLKSYKNCYCQKGELSDSLVGKIIYVIRQVRRTAHSTLLWLLNFLQFLFSYERLKSIFRLVLMTFALFRPFSILKQQ